MAVTSIWDVCELKMNVISCLRGDKCEAELARCARVHRSWTECALDALWFGYPGTTCEENRMRTTALPSLPHDRRQEYASRIGVLVFTAFDNPSVHAVFDKLAFPRLKEVVLHNVGIEFLRSAGYRRLLKYLQPTLESLRLTDNSENRPLKPLGNMSQLRYLEIVGKGIKNEHKLPARAFVPLGSLTRLRSLNISTSFSPCCIDQHDSVEPGFFNSRHKFTRADASAMFSRLTALEHLSIFIGGDEIGRLYGSLSEYCPYLSSIELLGDFDPQHLIQANAPVLGNVKKMSIENIKATMSSPLMAMLIYDFAPNLEKLSFTGEYSELFETRQVYTAWEKYRSTQHLLKNRKSSRIEGPREW